MKKTYYEILEIDKHASAEIIKKAYTTLAKKYHPDLQDGTLKQEYEEKLKLINEAYEIISDVDKRKKYDEELEQEELKTQAKVTTSQANVKKTYYSQNQNTTTTNNTPNQPQNHQTTTAYDAYYAEQIRQAQNKAYHDAYIQDMKNRGYKIRYKKTPKDYFKNFIALALTALILFLLWQIPFIRSLFKDNLLIQAIINLFP